MPEKMMTSIIVVVIVIVLVFVWVSTTSASARDMTGNKISFSQACLFWFGDSYKHSEFETTDGTINMNEQCRTALGVSDIDPTSSTKTLANPTFKQKCIDLCTSKRGETDGSSD
ncbi:MAG: hypothetical protein KJ906_00255 [Nanoarchaeota archaeon]|nr:hypothetical protein [Nanoarchaeota archaeon]